ncbi:MAG: hypothetical protein QW478_06185 [Candidatus Micrarchaeaceae archaeon]
MIDEINASSSKGMTVIIDSSGLKLTQRGDWLSTKWNVSRKGWIKMLEYKRMNVISLTIRNINLIKRNSEKS